VRFKNDRLLRERLGNAGKLMAMGHTAAKMADAYLKLYQSILAGQEPPHERGDS
jgi:hypothetical protein